MKIIKNEKLIKRNTTIGQVLAILGGVVAVGVAIYLIQTLINPEMVTGNTTWNMLIVLIISILISQASMYFGNRWGRSPRPDEKLDAALKGLPGDGILYHYSTSIPHLFIGAAGIWILLPYHQKGKVVFLKNRWKNSGGGFLQGYLRIFGQESIGRPDMEASHQASKLTKEIKKSLAEGEEVPPIYAALVFLDDKIEIEAEGSPYPAVPVKKLKDLLRKAAKEKPLLHTDLERVKAALPKE